MEKDKSADSFLPETAFALGVAADIAPSFMPLEERIAFDADAFLPAEPELAGTAEFTTTAVNRLLLIDSSLAEANMLAEAVAPDVKAILYNPHDNLAQISSQVQEALAGGKVASIGLAAHGSANAVALTAENSLTPEKAHAPEHLAFWQSLLSALLPDGRIDLLACEAGEVAEALEQSLGVNFAASWDLTGSHALGGNWILETDQIDASNLYFVPEAAVGFNFILANQPPSDIWLLDSTPHTLQDTASFLAGDTGTRFGYSLAADGDRLIIGEPSDGSEPGRCLVYRLDASGWMLEGTLAWPGLPNGSAFGSAVAISGDWALAVAEGNDSAYFCQRAGASWSIPQQFVGITSDDASFASAAMAGDLAAIGTPHANASGEVFVYQYDGNGWWPIGFDAPPPANNGDLLGADVAIVNGWLLIGAPGRDTASANAGAVYVYAWDNSNAEWDYAATLTPPEAIANANFGASISLCGNQAAISASGIDAVYIYSQSGSSWSLQQKIAAPAEATAGMFGSDVALSHNTLAVAAHDLGSAWIYQNANGSWSLAGNLQASDSVFAVAALPGMVLAGAPSASQVATCNIAPEIPEDAAAGSLVATIKASDPEGQTLSYSLVGGRTDLFTISGNRLLVKSGAFFDAQTAAQHSVVIRATDPLGAYREETFVIHIADVPDNMPPVTPPSPPSLPPPALPPIPLPPAAPGLAPAAHAPAAGEYLSMSGDDALGLENAATFAWQEERRIPLTPTPAEALLPALESGDLASRLADLAFGDELLDDPEQPAEIREAFTAILQAYVTSSEELSAYLQSAFRSVAEAAVLHKTAGALLQGAEQALPKFGEEPEASLAAYRELLGQVHSAQTAALRATAELRSAVLAAVSAGEAGFDRCLEDVVTAALAAINQSNDRMLFYAKCLEETLRRWRQGAAADAARPALAEIISAAKESAGQALEAERRRWDLASEDVFAAFLKRVVSDPKRLPRAPTPKP